MLAWIAGVQMMNFVLKTRNVAVNTRNCVSKTREIVSKMMKFAENDGLETLDRYVAIGHVVLGALTGRKPLSKRAEADLKRQQVRFQ